MGQNIVNGEPNGALRSWQQLQDEEKGVMFPLLHATPPVSLDMLSAVAGLPATQVLNIVELLKKKRLIKEDKACGKGFYFPDGQRVAGLAEASLADQAARTSLDHILGFYRQALPEGPERTLVFADLYHKLGDVSDEGLRCLKEAADLLFHRGEREKAARYYSALLRFLSKGTLSGDHAALFVASTLGSISASGHLVPLQEQIELLEEAHRVAFEQGLSESLARIRLSLGQALKAAGDYTRASHYFHSGWELAEEIGDPRLLRVAALSLVDFLFWKGHVAEAVRRYEEVVGNLEEFGEDEASLKASAMLGWCSVICGRVARGLGMIDAVRVKAQSLGMQDVCIYADLMSALSFMDIRNIEQTEAVLDRLFAQPDDVLGHYVLWAANAMKGYILFTRGKYQETFEYQKKAFEHSRILGWKHHRGPYNFEYLNVLEKHGLILPEMTYDSEIKRMLAWDDIYMKGVALRYRALRTIERKKGMEKALADLLGSEKYLTESGAEIELARTHVALGEVYLKRGEMRLAQSYLERAYAVLSKANKDLFPKELLSFMPQEQKIELMIDRMIAINESLGTIQDRASFLDRVINLTIDFTTAMRGAFFVLDEKGEPVIMASRNIDPLLLDSEQLQHVKHMVTEVSRREGEIIMPSRHGKDTEHTFAVSGLQAAVCMPARLGTRIYGYLYLDTRAASTSLASSQLPYIRLLCNQIAVGLSNIGTYEEMRLLKDRFEDEAHFYRREMGISSQLPEIVGTSPAMARVSEQIAQVAGTGSSVLITGETGVGKELLAKAIHSLSARREGPFIPVNLSALPMELVASELFGHEKGAFTGATERAKGRFELANGGTIFIDEVGDLALSVQVKLLRVLQEGSFERLGSGRTITSDFRVIVATNKDLRKEVERGAFRQDLYYRLNVFPILLPPLRERQEDIPLLAVHFLGKFSRKMGRRFKAIPRAEMQKLVGYQWPGNVRELEHFIERAVILSEGETVNLPKLEPASWGHPHEDILRPASLADYEREYVEKVLESTRWRVSGPNGAAAILSLKPTTLIARMKRLGLARSGA